MQQGKEVNVDQTSNNAEEKRSQCSNDFQLSRVGRQTLNTQFKKDETIPVRLTSKYADFPSQIWPGRIAQSVGHLTRKSGVLGLIPRLATYFRFSFRFFKKGNCQLLAKVCA